MSLTTGAGSARAAGGAQFRLLSPATITTAAATATHRPLLLLPRRGGGGDDDTGFLPRQLLHRRDTNAADCGESAHNCLDIKHADQCCDNDTYCFINKSDQVRCCPVGSNCAGDSYCSSNAFFCTTTFLTTVPLATISSSDGAAATATASNVTQQGCCGRHCPQTSPSDLGGKCCPYGARCQADGSCVQRKLPAASTGSSTGGGGGGAAGSRTAVVSAGSRAGSATSFAATGTDGVVVTEPEDLSTGAKTGIGIGAAVAVLLAAGLLAWLCLVKRNRTSRTRWRRQRKWGWGTAGAGAAGAGRDGGSGKEDIQGRAELVGSDVLPPSTSRVDGELGAASTAATATTTNNNNNSNTNYRDHPYASGGGVVGGGHGSDGADGPSLESPLLGEGGGRAGGTTPVEMMSSSSAAAAADERAASRPYTYPSPPPHQWEWSHDTEPVEGVYELDGARTHRPPSAPRPPPPPEGYYRPDKQDRF
ncbi:hypothetical protein AAL_00824 [Moelleriella libera RCEF 2490]|uniref:Uncharacterized protein n=1 Tax=Moelleriella libera RCEF 2490 TaxID=1081109 RepID=A0A166V7M5_9HYPO|nr:hypothetical protein AAL_00824 [Moelleriella libera RCEF 2490]